MCNWYNKESTTGNILITKLSYSYICLHKNRVKIREGYTERL